jgi:carbon-monoxide dehydrogenase medium subunit
LVSNANKTCLIFKVQININMIPSKFNYSRATSVQDAISKLGGEAKLLAGGHSLIPAMKLRLNQPTDLIDISRIDTIKQITDEADSVLIGAGVTHGEIANSSLVRSACAMVSDGAAQIGDIQVRNKGTIGGSIAHADPAADWPAIIIAADGVIILEGAGGSREVPAASFFTGFYETALEENEIITGIRIPKLKSGSSSNYVKFAQPASRFAIVGCAVVKNLDSEGEIGNIKVSITGVSEFAYRDHGVEDELMGKPLTAEVIESAAAKAAESVDVMSDHYASEEYRKHLAKVYVKKALTELM